MIKSHFQAADLGSKDAGPHGRLGLQSHIQHALSCPVLRSVQQRHMGWPRLLEEVSGRGGDRFLNLMLKRKKLRCCRGGGFVFRFPHLFLEANPKLF